MRRTAILLALLVAVLDLAAFGLGEARIVGELGSVFELGIDAWLSRVNVTVVFVLPWVVGAVLLWRGQTGLGAAVVVPAALLVTPRLLLVARTVTEAAEIGGPGIWIEVSALVASWLLAVAAGATAWLARPRAGTRKGSPGRGNAYVILAFLAWLPTILASTQFVVPGAEGHPEGARHLYEFIWTGMGNLGATLGIAEAVVFGALLVLGPALRRDMAGAVILVVALPALISEVQTIVTVWGEDFVISTPASILGAAGLIGLVVIGASWLVRGSRSRAALSADEDGPPDPEAPEGSARGEASGPGEFGETRGETGQ